MAEIDVAALEPVGEFGSKAWCEACARYGIQMLEDGDLPPDTAWGFSEIYTHPPARLLEGGREMSAYYLMVKDGQVSGGDGAPEECRALPGFHVRLPWASICNQSRTKYGREGQMRRSAQEKVMFGQIEEHVGRPNPLGLGGGPPHVWPKAVGMALGKGMEEGGGLHNIAASLQTTSPEFSDFPLTDMGVPDFGAMREEQKLQFLALLAVKV